MPEARGPGSALSPQLGVNKIFFRRSVVADVENMCRAADLAVFDIRLPAPCGFIHGGSIPLAAACALEACIHYEIISQIAGLTEPSGFSQSPIRSRLVYIPHFCWEECRCHKQRRRRGMNMARGKRSS